MAVDRNKLIQEAEKLVRQGKIDKAIGLFEQAMEAGVAFIPGAGFCLGGGGRSEARLSYSREPLDVLARGAEVLGKIASKAFAQNLR